MLNILGACFKVFNTCLHFQGLGTEARYDARTQEFVLNTPNFESAKCWSGNLAKTATHAR